MDSMENRRKSKRLSEKCENSNEVINKINNKKTKTKSKSNSKCVKLKENDRNGQKRVNGLIVDIDGPKYGLRKLAPINWKERLDTRHITSDNKSIDKTKGKNSPKIDDKVSKVKEKKFKANRNLDKINGKFHSKVSHKLSEESIKISDNKRHKKRKTFSTSDKFCHKVIDKTEQNKYNQRLNNEIEDQLIDSTQRYSDFCQTDDHLEPLQESKDEEKDQQLSDISYIQYLEMCSESESKGPSLSLNIIINLLNQRLKNKRRNTAKSDPLKRKRRLYSCGYDLCDSKKCQNH